MQVSRISLHKRDSAQSYNINWKSLTYWPMIERVVKEQIGKPNLSRIIQTLQDRDPRFNHLTHQRLSDWRDKTQKDKIIWSEQTLQDVRKGFCHRSCFGIYTSLKCWTHNTQERWQLLLSGQMVKLSGWSHGLSRALSHDWAYVPSPNHDSSPLMTRHVVSPYLLIYQPHLWLAATLSFSFALPSHTSGWTPHFPLAILALPQPHFWLAPTLIFPLSIYPYRC